MVTTEKIWVMQIVFFKMQEIEDKNGPPLEMIQYVRGNFCEHSYQYCVREGKEDQAAFALLYVKAEGSRKVVEFSLFLDGV